MLKIHDKEVILKYVSSLDISDANDVRKTLMSIDLHVHSASVQGNRSSKN
jgi:hypothetical protein